MTESATIDHDPIPETVADALEKWDSGRPVFSIEMGGLGPGYEQGIQIGIFTILRELNGKDLPEEHGAINAVLDEVIRKSPCWDQYSGAQVGAAKSAAYHMLKKGYRKAVRELPDDRLIQVQKNFPC